MPKSVRSGIKVPTSVADGRRLFFEALNPHFGFFYTVKKTVKKAKTAFQEIELIDTDEFGKVLLLDNITQLGERNDFSYHEPMVHPALCCHPDPRSVLVIGGGDGGILREVLKYSSVQRVDLAELDHDVIDFSRRYLSSVHRGSFNDERLHINIVDGRKYTLEHPGEFDIIIMDMTDPSGPSRLLYTDSYFRLVRRAFRNPHGIFVMHSESPVSRPVAFTCITKTLRSVFSNVNQMFCYMQMYGVLWSISVCSPLVNISLMKPYNIDRRLSRNGIRDLKMYNGSTHRAMQTPYPFITSLLQRRARIITDRNPDFSDDFIS